MENKKKCECCIGILHNYDDTSMVTLNGLKYHIKDQLELKQSFEKDALFKNYNHGIIGWTLADYCDRRKTTDLTRFNYCPDCGKKIDWKAIKNGVNDDKSEEPGQLKLFIEQEN